MATSLYPSSVRSSLDAGESDSDYKLSSPASALFSGPPTEFTSELESLASVEEDDDDDDDATFDMLGSPAPSVYSLTDSLRANSFREEMGRKLQNHSDIYQLPADGPELDRLNKQHTMLQLVMGRYPAPLYDILAPAPGLPKSVLDLGCGSACWLIDIARDFPHIDAVGVDLVPIQAHDVPVNVRTEVDDINLGLEHFYGAFDIVHMRLISAGIKDYAGLIDQVSRILRPGGLIIASECDFRVYDDAFRPYLPAPTESGSESDSERAVPAVARYIHEMRRAARARGGSVDAAPLLKIWTEQHKWFEDIVYRDFFFPLAPFVRGDSKEAERQRMIGRLSREDSTAFMESGRPLLIKSGLPQDEVDTLLARAAQELVEAKVPVYLRCQSVYARKKQH